MNIKRGALKTKAGAADVKGVFVVGCPRSGTTVLQSHLARHPGVVTFPESHFFSCALPGRGWLKTLTGRPSSRAKDKLMTFASAIGCDDAELERIAEARTLNQLTAVFISLMSSRAAEQDAVWLEKTPGHLHYIDYIIRRVSGCRFIHIVRDGPDVVDSLYRVTHQYPEHWSGKWPLEQCVARWQWAIRDSSRWCSDRNAHHVVFFEEFVEDPRASLRAMLAFLDFERETETLDSMLSADSGDSNHIYDFEHWKSGSEAAVQASNREHGVNRPADELMERVRRELSATDLSALRRAADDARTRV